MSKTAIITGAAKGMGVHMALRLGKMGYNVVLTYVSNGSKERGEALAQRIREEYGVEAMACQCDVVDYDGFKKLVETIDQQLGNISVLVNNAGVCEPRKFLDETPEYWNRIVQVNFVGVINACHVVLPYLLRDGVENANIVVTTSVGSLTAFPDFVTYDAAKAGAMGLVRELAAEYAPKVRVNAVAPGGVATDLLLANAEKNPEYFATMQQGFPMKRFVEMSEIADGMEYLINAKAITGITLPITCGAYMS